MISCDIYEIRGFVNSSMMSRSRKLDKQNRKPIRLSMGIL